MADTNDSEQYIGLFNDSFPPILDGVTLTVQNYAEQMSHLGEHPCVVTPSNPVRVSTDYNVIRYFSLPILSRRPYRYGYPKLDLRIWQRMRKVPFKIIHSHCPFSSGRMAVYAARHQHVPLIGTFHSKYRSDLEHSLRRLPFVVDRVMKNIISFFNACDHVWIPQASVEDTVREYGYEGPLTVVENGNDLASRYDVAQMPRIRSEAKRNLCIDDRDIALLFVGQHIREKGIDIIAQALTRLPSDITYVMNFVGTGYALRELRDFVERHGLDKNVRINGIVSERDKIAEYYAASDLFLFPSFYDNAPLVVREAAAMQTPSVLLRGSTAAEVIRDGENGFLTERTPQAYAEVISTLAKNPERIREAGRNARASLTRTWENVTVEVMERYQDIISQYQLK